MGRYCSDCDEYRSCSSFSRNQWRKGDGYSRCRDCVDWDEGNKDYSFSFQCGTCDRIFNSQNELDMHMQVHRPRNVACPVCGERRFRSGSAAVQHVESGYCTGCSGRGNARKQIYKFASRQKGMSRYLNETPMLEYGGGYDDNEVPDEPYCCPMCSKSFRHMSQLLQHQDNKHNTRILLTYK